MKITRRQLRKLIQESVEKFVNSQDALQNPRHRRSKDPADRPMQGYVDSGIMQFRGKLDDLYRQSEESGDASYANTARELEYSLTDIPVSEFNIKELIVVSRFNPSAGTANGRENVTIKVVIPKSIVKSLIESIDEYESGNYNSLDDILSDIRRTYYRYVGLLDEAVARVGPGAYIDEVIDNFEGISADGAKRFQHAIETAGNLVG